MNIKINKPLFLSIVTLLNFSCASQMPGYLGTEVSGKQVQGTQNRSRDLEVSLDEISSLSSKEYRGFLISIKNNSSTWFRGQITDLSIQNADTDILLGDDLKIYLMAMIRYNSLEKVPGRDASNMAISSIVYTQKSLRENSDILTIASLVDQKFDSSQFSNLAGTTSFSKISPILNSNSRHEFSALLPEAYSLKKFSIPPGLAYSSWIVVKLPSKMDYNVLKLTVKDKSEASSQFVLPSAAHVKYLGGQYQVKKRAGMKSVQEMNEGEFIDKSLKGEI